MEGGSNTIVGDHAGYSGSDNAFVNNACFGAYSGAYALDSSNTYLGNLSAYSNRYGGENVAVGATSLCAFYAPETIVSTLSSTVNS